MLDRLIFNTCVLVWSFNKSRSLRSQTSYRNKSPHPSVNKGEGVGDRTLTIKNVLKKRLHFYNLNQTFKGRFIGYWVVSK